MGLRTTPAWFGERVVRMQLPDGRHARLASLGQNYLSFQLFWLGAGFYEPITRMVMEELLRPGDTFLDVGANVGFFSIVLPLAKPGIRVIAFEPNPKNFQMLKKNALVNNLTQVTCEPLALSDADGTAPLYLSDSDMSASLRKGFELHAHKPVAVNTVRLDSYLATHKVTGPLLIKVDVEGHEEAFFRGAQETLAARKPDVIMEVVLHYAPESFEFLQRLGYSFYQITNEGLIKSPRLTPLVKNGLCFYNYLLTVKSGDEIASLFQRIQKQVNKIDFRKTSKFVEHPIVRN